MRKTRTAKQPGREKRGLVPFKGPKPKGPAPNKERPKPPPKKTKPDKKS